MNEFVCEKYADQDEEERSIRMDLLAAAGKPRKNTENSENENTTVEKESKPAPDASKICYKCKKADHTSRECPEQADEIEVDKRGERERLEKVKMEEDDMHEVGEEEREKLNDVEYLTGKSVGNDVLLYAVPMCGPSNALQSDKDRVKNIPGSFNKGKAAKTAMNLFSHMSEATSREKELMKDCTQPELVAALGVAASGRQWLFLMSPD